MVPYVNSLSDLYFVMARLANQLERHEKKWNGIKRNECTCVKRINLFRSAWKVRVKIESSGEIMSDNSITTKGLTKIFGRFTAVDALNLNVRGGELFGLLGPNGAGKTTTVRMLCTLTEPTHGTATVAGYDIREQASEVRRKIGVVSDGVSLYKDLTIEENLRLFSTLYGLSHSKAAEADSRTNGHVWFQRKIKATSERSLFRMAEEGNDLRCTPPRTQSPLLGRSDFRAGSHNPQSHSKISPENSAIKV